MNQEIAELDDIDKLDAIGKDQEFDQLLQLEQTHGVGAELTIVSESKKERDFLSEPIGDKPVTAIAGIGLVTAQRMASLGIVSARQLVGIFLKANCDRALFRAELEANFKISKNHLVAITNSIGSYVDSYIT